MPTQPATTTTREPLEPEIDQEVGTFAAVHTEVRPQPA